MRIIPILAMVGMFSTAAVAQNMDTSNAGNPNRPGHNMSSNGGMMHSHKMSHHQRMMMHKKMMRKKMMMKRGM